MQLWPSVSTDSPGRRLSRAAATPEARMLGELESLLGCYDRGEISRREMLGALMLLAIPVQASAATEPAVGAARLLNHVTLYVSDVAKARTFYQDLFGMPVLTEQDPGVNLRIGSGF